MGKETVRADVSSDLYALVVYLHASANRDLFAAIGTLELSFSQLKLLERLRGGRRTPTIKQAAALMHVSLPAASRITDSLARRGLVRRETDDRDFRAKRILITPRGEQAIAQLHAARHEEIIAFCDQLDVDEREQLAAALRPVVDHEQIAVYRPAPPPA
ncbi:MAG TPA: MarR family transcriptional regulator [Solirubrobacteraceae bacterium]|jgi:DNA-binding MarR family transcriptional regulator|nr:MarR family transcriptional regulator [Solirubrobacteraceae bacterium]